MNYLLCHNLCLFSYFKRVTQTLSLRVVECTDFANFPFAVLQDLLALFAAGSRTRAGDDSQNLVLAHNQQLFAVDLDL